MSSLLPEINSNRQKVDEQAAREFETPRTKNNESAEVHSPVAAKKDISE